MIDPKNVLAKDLMRTDVATLSADDTIVYALEVFEENRISGAPVVANGKLVGVLTLTDVARQEHRREGQLATRRDYDLAEPDEEPGGDFDPDAVVFDKEDYSPEVLGEERVADWMSSGVVTVRPDTPLGKVCQAMVDNRIHRVFVAEGERLLGLVSSFDVVRLLAGGGARG